MSMVQKSIAGVAIIGVLLAGWLLVLNVNLGHINGFVAQYELKEPFAPLKRAATNLGYTMIKDDTMKHYLTKEEQRVYGGAEYVYKFYLSSPFLFGAGGCVVYHYNGQIVGKPCIASVSLDVF